MRETRVTGLIGSAVAACLTLLTVGCAQQIEGEPDPSTAGDHAAATAPAALAAPAANASNKIDADVLAAIARGESSDVVVLLKEDDSLAVRALMVDARPTSASPTPKRWRRCWTLRRTGCSRGCRWPYHVAAFVPPPARCVPARARRRCAESARRLVHRPVATMCSPPRWPARGPPASSRRWLPATAPPETPSAAPPARGPPFPWAAVYAANVGSLRSSLCTDATSEADKVACFSNSASFLSLLAPGVNITAAGITMSGTSQATPHVAGAAAVLRAAFPSENVDDTLARMRNSGKPITHARNKIVTPRIEVSAALGTGAAVTPGPSGTPIINSGAKYTKTAAGTVNVAPKTGTAKQVCLSNSGDSCSSWKTYAASQTWTLSAGDGNKTVFVWWKDASGNASVAAGNASIILDTTVPTAARSPRQSPRASHPYLDRLRRRRLRRRQLQAGGQHHHRPPRPRARPPRARRPAHPRNAAAPTKR